MVTIIAAGASVFFCNTNALAQAKQKWATGLNTLSNGDGMGSKNNAAVVFYSDNIARMWLTASGGLGLGTPTPSQLLDVAGGFHLGGNAYIDSFLTALSVTTGSLSVTGSSALNDVQANSLTVTGTVDAGQYLLGGTPLTPSPWVSSGNDISYAAGTVAIGTSTSAANSALTIVPTYNFAQLNKGIFIDIPLLNNKGSYAAIVAEGETDYSTVKGTYFGRLASAKAFSADGQMIGGVWGAVKPEHIQVNQSNRIALALGGYFTADLQNLTIGNPGVSKNWIGGIYAEIKGTVTNCPNPGHGVIAAVIGNDKIGRPDSYAAWFDGKGYFSDRVGIGTETPAVALDVVGEIRADEATFDSIHIIDSIKVGNSIIVGGVATGTSTNNHIYSDNGNLYLQVSPFHPQFDVIISSQNPSHVGIGTGIPQRKLHIYTNSSNPGTTNPGLRLEHVRLLPGNQLGTSVWDLIPVVTSVSKLTIGTPGNPMFALTEHSPTKPGRCGINTASPEALLDINDPTPEQISQGEPLWTTSNFLKAINVPSFSVVKWNDAIGNGVAHAIGKDAQGLFFAQSQSDDDSQPIRYNMIIHNSGHVGIGTRTITGLSAPSTRLHVNAPSSNNLVATFATHDFILSDKGSRFLIYMGAITGDTYSAIQAQDEGGDSNNDLILQAFGGKVGIGTTIPSTTLHVAGKSVFAEDGVTLSPGLLTPSGVQIHQSTDSKPPNGQVALIVGDTSARSMLFAPYLGPNSYNPLSEDGDIGIIFRNGVNNAGGSGFVLAPQFASRAGIRITPDGNVGIGTSLVNNPNGYRLAVNGIIGAKDVWVENTSTTWPDFVLKRGYHLRTIPELGEFIYKYNRLPGFLSAEEIKEKRGISMAETQYQQQITLEEYARYFVILDKRINQLENENKKKDVIIKKQNTQIIKLKKKN